LSLASARALAIETREGRTSGTIAALAEIYLKSVSGLRSASGIGRRLRRDVLPLIGHIPLRELHRRDVTRVIDGKSAPIAARKVFEDVRAMVRWAVSRGDLDHNPIDGLRGPPISKVRTRVLTGHEIRVLWRRLDQVSEQCQRVIKLCLVTAQRVGEVAGLTLNEIDLDRRVWNIPGSRTKNGHPHSVPLSQWPLTLSPKVLQALVENTSPILSVTTKTSLELIDGLPMIFGELPLLRWQSLGLRRLCWVTLLIIEQPPRPE
jgi:integrase